MEGKWQWRVVREMRELQKSIGIRPANHIYDIVYTPLNQTFQVQIKLPIALELSG